MNTGFYRGLGYRRDFEPELTLADAQGWRRHLILRLLGREYDDDLWRADATAERERALTEAKGLRRFLIRRLLRRPEPPPDLHILW